MNHVWEQIDQGIAYCLNCPATSAFGHGRECMNVWSFFERRVCLTLGPDWPIACEEFERVGLERVWRFDALPDIGPHESNNRSTRQMLVDFYSTGLDTLLMLEDDVQFRDISHLEQALKELPEDWDVVHLGANIVGDAVRVSPHLFKVTNAWTNHAKGFRRKIVPFILENQPGFSEVMHDTWFGQQYSSGVNAYVVAPMVAIQRPHYSSIWKRDGQPDYADYSDVWAASDAKLI